MLTSGGGWQDQIGGLYPGAKISESPRNPSQLVVKTDEISELKAGAFREVAVQYTCIYINLASHLSM